MNGQFNHTKRSAKQSPNRKARHTRLQLELLENRVQPTSLVGFGGLGTLATNVSLHTGIDVNVVASLQSGAYAGAHSMAANSSVSATANVSASPNASANAAVDAALSTFTHSGRGIGVAGLPSISQVITEAKYGPGVAVNSFGGSSSAHVATNGGLSARPAGINGHFMGSFRF